MIYRIFYVSSHNVYMNSSQKKRWFILLLIIFDVFANKTFIFIEDILSKKESGWSASSENLQRKRIIFRKYWAENGNKWQYLPRIHLYILAENIFSIYRVFIMIDKSIVPRLWLKNVKCSECLLRSDTIFELMFNKTLFILPHSNLDFT